MYQLSQYMPAMFPKPMAWGLDISRCHHPDHCSLGKENRELALPASNAAVRKSNKDKNREEPRFPVEKTDTRLPHSRLLNAPRIQRPFIVVVQLKYMLFDPSSQRLNSLLARGRARRWSIRVLLIRRRRALNTILLSTIVILLRLSTVRRR
jgi:hypothetical protein